MPTTAPWIVQHFLSMLRRRGVPFAVLHREADLEAVVSDIDLVVGIPVPDLVRKVFGSIREYKAVMLWPYDAGGASNLFLATPDLNEGAQLDFLYDPSGKGRLGLRSTELLDCTVDGSRFPTLDNEAQLVYLLRKRLVKGDEARFEHLAREALANRATVERLAQKLCAPRAFNALTRALDDDRPLRELPRVSPARLVSRLKVPVGAWINWATNDPEPARELNRRATALFPHHVALELPHRGRPGWWMRKVQPVRMRAGLVATWGLAQGYPRPDLNLRGSEIETVVDFLSARLAQRLAFNPTEF